MKFKTIGLLVIASVVASTAVLAQSSDDRKWVNQCARDNAGTASIAVIYAYCVCMNDKMDENETRSISVWEKANPAAMRACERQSGWK